MHASLLISLLALTSLAAQAAGIEEIHVSDRDDNIILRADGTAELSYRGRFNDGVRDERVGIFQAKLEPRDFRRLAALPGAIGFDGLKDSRVAFPTRIVSIAVVRDGQRRVIERQERRTADDGGSPPELWTLEMAARGLATQLTWQPIPSGVRIELGEKRELRAVMVREAASQVPVAMLQTRQAEVEVPVRPGAYLVEVSIFRDGKWIDLRNFPVSVKPDNYASVVTDR
jgi:hypothetical protein